MGNTNIANRILKAIQEKKLKPKGRWQFILKNVFMWTSGILALLFSAVAFSVMIYLLNNMDLAFAATRDTSALKALFMTLPYFWVFFIGAFIFVVYHQVRHTRKGYLYTVPKIIATSIVLSILLGAGFSFIGWGEKIDHTISSNSPFYGEVINPQIHFWSMPEEGRLVGLVKNVNSDSVKLIDKDGKTWDLKFMENSDPSFLQENIPIRLHGEVVSESEFEVFRVMPLGPGRGMFRHHRQPGMEGPCQGACFNNH